MILIIREAAVWCLSALHGLGQTLWFPAVPERPQRQLRWLEGNLHRQQQCCKCVNKCFVIISDTTPCREKPGSVVKSRMMDISVV